MYNSARGRFLTPDPIGLKSARLELPQSLNRYSYVLNDPVNSVDPSGLLTIVIGGFLNGDADWLPEMSDILWDTFGEEPEVWKWAGVGVSNFTDYLGIEIAGRRLAAYIISKLKDGEQLNIVAHSHGGNVVKAASWFLLPGTITNLVTLGTPQNYDLKPLNRLAVGNYCNVSSLADPVQFGGASLGQITKTVQNTKQGAYYASRGAWEVFRGDFALGVQYLALSARYFAEATAWYMSTKVDPLAFNKNVLLTSESHPDLHTERVWKNIRGDCGLKSGQKK
jgi:hypothetical protein